MTFYANELNSASLDIVGSLWRACRRKNLISASTMLADSSLDFMNDSVSMLPNDRVTEDTSNLMSNLSIDDSVDTCI